jgi:sulfatase modifying factor 1
VTAEAGDLLALAREREARGDSGGAATAYDEAYGLDPDNLQVAEERRRLLDRLAVSEHGMTFRYIPAGAFLMGAEHGEADEQPVHPVELAAYWLSETPVSWAAYCRLMDWEPPPHGRPRGSGDGYQATSSSSDIMFLLEDNKIRAQYCEDMTTGVLDWHAHIPEVEPRFREIFGTPPRGQSTAPFSYEQKPMVSVSWQDAEELGARLSTGSGVTYRLPTEAEWEKAARGGLVNRAYPWGDARPTVESCDFDRLEQTSIRPVRRFPPNGYGLYAMSGGVWEWTADWYDARYYRHGPVRNPVGPRKGRERALRGGSWTDCADAVRVSFRMSREAASWREPSPRRHATPTIGFRLCRAERAPIPLPSGH